MYGREVTFLQQLYMGSELLRDESREGGQSSARAGVRN